MKFKVEYKTISVREVEVDADTMDKAIKMVKDGDCEEESWEIDGDLIILTAKSIE
mgnify:CR=1 FL=1